MRLHRLIAILLLMESRGTIKAKELADALETSKRTIYRDIDLLCESGVPITSSAGRLGGYSLMDGYQVNMKSLHRDELVTLYLSALGVQPSDHSNSSILLKNAILKMENAASSHYKEDIQKAKERFFFDPQTWWEEKPELSFLDSLRNAVFESHKVTITYTSSSRGQQHTTTRTIQPYGLVIKDTQWYLVAYCESRFDMRVFKCERIEKVVPLDEPFSVPSDFDLESFWEDWKKKFEQLLAVVPHYPVTLRLISIPISNLTKMDLLDEQESRVTVNLYTRENASKRIEQFGNQVEVLSPPELRKEMIQRARSILNMYQETQS